MHELGLCRDLLRQLEREAQSRDFRRVRRVRVELSAAEGVTPEALRLGFALVSRGSLAEDAELEVCQRPARFPCPHCRHELEWPPAPAQAGECCPRCGRPVMLPHAGGGASLRIRELEVE